MIRVPNFVAYFIGCVACVAIALQGRPQLLEFLGVSTQFNFIARIGFLVWAFWMFLLSTRGYQIYMSRFPINQGNFGGGYKVLFATFGIGAFLIYWGAM